MILRYVAPWTLCLLEAGWHMIPNTPLTQLCRRRVAMFRTYAVEGYPIHQLISALPVWFPKLFADQGVILTTDAAPPPYESRTAQLVVLP
jgi:hypothetical protein